MIFKMPTPLLILFIITLGSSILAATCGEVSTAILFAFWTSILISLKGCFHGNE